MATWFEAVHILELHVVRVFGNTKKKSWEDKCTDHIKNNNVSIIWQEYQLMQVMNYSIYCSEGHVKQNYKLTHWTEESDPTKRTKETWKYAKQNQDCLHHLRFATDHSDPATENVWEEKQISGAVNLHTFDSLNEYIILGEQENSFQEVETGFQNSKLTVWNLQTILSQGISI